MKSDNKSGWTKKGNNTDLLRMGVVLLSLVSFFTTANGMKRYIFAENSVISYAASAAIQGILLALSMNLPGYLRGIWAKPVEGFDITPNKDYEAKPEEDDSRTEVGEVTKLLIEDHAWVRENSGKIKEKKSPSELDGYLQAIINFGKWICHTLIRSFLCLCALILTIITIFCSSWFSYIYIAEVIHKDSWGTDSQLLVQQTYRTELYNARDYAHNYRIYLEESMGDKILMLEEQAKQLSDSVVDLEMDWDAERRRYVSESDAGNRTTAESYMATVIDAMESAMAEGASQEAKDLAVTAVADAKTNITNRMEDIQQNINTLDSNITNYNSQIANLTDRISRATADTDITRLTNSLNRYTELIEETTQRQSILQAEYMQLDDALLRLPFYESRLGLSNSTSAISIRSSLIELQSEFFQQEPDEQKMLDIATDIFDRLREAARTVSGETDGGNSAGEDAAYTRLLLQMNRLIRNLTDYSEIKDIESDLEGMIDELRVTGDINDTDADDRISESTDSPGDSLGETESIEETESEEGAEQFAEAAESAETVESTEEAESAETTGSTDASEPAETPEPTETAQQSETMESSESAQDNDTKWKKTWNARLEALKAQISAMSVYSEAEGIEDEFARTLSESQIHILQNYDRSKASMELDDMIRRYISTHNAIYQGIIYLQSPYRALAMFALILALSFDLSGFIFGFVAQGNSPLQDDSLQNNIQKSRSGELPGTDKNDQEEWSVIGGLNQYIVLTGDYERRDGTYYYKTFKDGKLYRWGVKDQEPYIQGIYIQGREQKTKGEPLPLNGQKLVFAGQADGPRDGIYMDCRFAFDDGGLILIQREPERRSFLASINEYVPVHSYSPDKGENRTIPAKKLSARYINAKVAVVSLNAKGTSVAAIYMIETSN